MDAIYIHIPFCERICFYCDFPKKVSKTKEIDNYLDALYEETKMYSIKNNINTIYIGGGSPSILNIKQLEKLSKVISQFNISRDYEFTIECNPEQLTLEKILFFKKMGVNRISLGVQTFNDKLLKLLNRNHSEKNVLNVVELLKQNDLNNISIDLIFALPTQKIEDIETDLKIFNMLDIPHLSYYSLILEGNTVFDKWVNEGKLKLTNNETEANMYTFIIEKLKNMGYKHYEISNFAKENYHSRHNLKYWENKEYIGLGMGASGYYKNFRYYNVNHVNEYIKLVRENKKPIKQQDFIDKGEYIKEALLLGLRLIDGLSVKEFNQRYQVDVLNIFKEELNYLQKKGWIEINNNIKLTEIGLFYGNEVFQMFI